MGKGGVDAWAWAHVMQALESNPSTPLEIPAHGTTNTRQYRPSYGLGEAVEAAYNDLMQQGQSGHPDTFRDFDRILRYGGGKGPFSRLRKALGSELNDPDAEALRTAFVKDLIAQMALDRAEVRIELDKRQRACIEAAA